jgi:hypothetical protein
MKYIKTFEQFINEQEEIINEAVSVSPKDWDRMLSLVMKGDDGETASKLITKKEKAIARFVAGLKLNNSPINFNTNWNSFSGAFRPLGDKAIELGATFDEIESVYNSSDVPSKYIEKMTKLGGKKLNNTYAGPISKTVLDAGFDIEYLPHSGNAITNDGKDAMRNGRKWTIGYRTEIDLGKKKVNFTFDAITDEGGGATFYVLSEDSDDIFSDLLYNKFGVQKFLTGLKDILNKQ